MKTIIGLGNPGFRYKFSRHNIGFMVIEKLAKANQIRLRQRAFDCLLGRGRIGKQEVLLGQPLTYMNLSAKAVVPIVRQKKLNLSDLLVICDDVNLPLGEIRIRSKGSAGGHNGLASIITGLGTPDYPRLRVGIGRPRQAPDGNKLSGHVLGYFNKRETAIINQAIEKAVDCCYVWLEAGINTAMDKFN